MSDLVHYVILPGDHNRMWRVGLYPVVIWALEIVQGTILKKVYGRNVAWDYSRNRFGCIDGLIDLSMVLEWWLIGLVMEIIYYPHIVELVDRILVKR